MNDEYESQCQNDAQEYFTRPSVRERKDRRLLAHCERQLRIAQSKGWLTSARLYSAEITRLTDRLLTVAPF